MEEKDIQNQLVSIRAMMERSSKFISLSGLSGILAGIYALIGAVASYLIIRRPVPQDFVPGFFSILQSIKYLLLIGLVVFLLSVGTGLLLTYRKAKKMASLYGAKPAARYYSTYVYRFSRAHYLRRS